MLQYFSIFVFLSKREIRSGSDCPFFISKSMTTKSEQKSFPSNPRRNNKSRFIFLPGNVEKAAIEMNLFEFQLFRLISVTREN
jgi:hypothetical protein